AIPSGAAAAAALALGIALALLERTRHGRWVPAPLPLGLGFILNPWICLTVALGSLAGLALERWRREWAAANLIALAAGGIAGDSLMVVAIAALVAAGVL